MSSLDNTQTRIAAQLNAFKVAAIQMASGPNVEGNLSEARRLVAKAAEQGAKLVVLPEFFAIMGMTEQDKVKVREQPGQGAIQQFMSETARKHKIWLLGSLPLAATTPDKVRNSLLVYDETGAQVARYDKIHLFNLTLGNESYNEAQTIEAGNKVVVVDSPFGRIGLAVCYDLRFPEIFRAMKDVNIIVLPSAFTATTGKVHWEPLVRARAIENLVLCRCRSPGRLPRQRPRNARPHHDRRPLGSRHGRTAARFRRGHRRREPQLPRQPAQEPARIDAPNTVLR